MRKPRWMLVATAAAAAVALGILGLRGSVRTTRTTQPRQGSDNTGRFADGDLAESPAPGEGVARVQVQVRPDGDLLDWELGVWSRSAETAEKRCRKNVRGVGSKDLQLALPCGRYLARLRAEGMPQDLEQGFVVAAQEPSSLSFVLYAPGCATGTVRDVHGHAIRGATVMLIPESIEREDRRPHEPPLAPREVAADEDGNYAIADVDPRVTYTLACARTGCVPERRTGLRVDSRESIRHDFVLRPAGRVVGRLLGAGGEPLGGVNLCLSRLADKNEQLVRWDPEANAVTSEAGTFVFECLAEGRKKILATPLYVTGKSAVGQWPVQVTAGRTADLGDLHLLCSTVRLKLVRTDGSTVTAARIRVTLVPTESSSPDPIVLYVFAGGDGVAVVEGLPRGRLDLMIVDTSRERRRRGVDPTRKTLEFAGGHLETTITLAEQQPPESTGKRTVQFQLPEMTRGSFLLITSGERILTSVAGDAAKQDANAGSLPMLPGMPRSVRILCVSGGVFTEQTLDLQATAPERVQLRPDRPGRCLEVHASRHGRPVVNRPVFLALTGSLDGDCAVVGFTDKQGVLVLDGLPPHIDFWIRVLGSSGPGQPLAVAWGPSGTTRLEYTIEPDTGPD